MPRTKHRRERQRAHRLRLPHHTPTDLPRPPPHARPLPRAVPLKLIHPHPVRDPIALPIIRARVQQHAHPAREERGDVRVRAGGPPLVEVRAEVGAHERAAGGEGVWRGRAEERAEGGGVEEGGDGGVFGVAEGAVAGLRDGEARVSRLEVDGGLGGTMGVPWRCRRGCALRERLDDDTGIHLARATYRFPIALCLARSRRS